MSINETILSRDQKVLIAVEERAEEGGTIRSISRDVELSEASVRRTITKLENFGMVRGEWIKDNGTWKRKYVLAGEGTKEFIAALKKTL